MRYVVIMAGGSGTRLWPLSRKGTPKQLLKLVDGRSLLRLAFDRAVQVVPAEKRGRVYMMHLNRAACAEAGRTFGFSCAAP